jgi:PadR family transcriptional regulator, regulatory protein AphA
MSLEYAILGFLQYKPLSGYDLKKIFDTSVQHFWSADQSQIYRTLARLADDGLAAVEVVPQDDRPDRKVYSITPAGSKALHKWLQGPFPASPNRSAPLIQVFFSGQLTDEEIKARFEQARALFENILERYQSVPAQIDEYVRMVDSPRETYFWLLTLELGIKTMQAEVEWANGVLALIESGQLPQK